MEDIWVTVRWFASLRERRGIGQERVRVPAGTTAAALFAELVPPEHRIPVAVVRGADRVPADTTLADGDEVAFLPPLGGG